MKRLPKSRLFEGLVWDVEIPQWPTLNGRWTLPDGRDIEVAMVGNEVMPFSWTAFTKQSEACGQAAIGIEKQMLAAALPQIAKLHGEYFPGRLRGAPEALLGAMSLRLMCFYTFGSMHLSYQGTEIFNHLDVDIGLDGDLEVMEVRFDG